MGDLLAIQLKDLYRDNVKAAVEEVADTDSSTAVWVDDGQHFRIDVSEPRLAKRMDQILTTRDGRALGVAYPTGDPLDKFNKLLEDYTSTENAIHMATSVLEAQLDSMDAAEKNVRRAIDAMMATMSGYTGYRDVRHNVRIMDTALQKKSIVARIIQVIPGNPFKGGPQWDSSDMVSTKQVWAERMRVLITEDTMFTNEQIPTGKGGAGQVKTVPIILHNLEIMAGYRQLKALADLASLARGRAHFLKTRKNASGSTELIVANAFKLVSMLRAVIVVLKYLSLVPPPISPDIRKFLTDFIQAVLAREYASYIEAVTGRDVINVPGKSYPSSVLGTLFLDRRSWFVLLTPTYDPSSWFSPRLVGTPTFRPLVATAIAEMKLPGS